MTRPAASRSSSGRRNRVGRWSIIAVVPVLAILAGCAPLATPAEEVPETPSVPEVPEVPEVRPEFVPDGSAAENLPYFNAVLHDFAAGEAPVEGRPIVDSVIAAGFAPEAMQVSFDRTKTDLVADGIFVSVRIAEECLIGQVITGDRSVATMTAPAVGPDQNLCLIGNTRPIDW